MNQTRYQGNHVLETVAMATIYLRLVAMATGIVTLIVMTTMYSRLKPSGECVHVALASILISGVVLELHGHSIPSLLSHHDDELYRPALVLYKDGISHTRTYTGRSV